MAEMTNEMSQQWSVAANCYAYACNRKTPGSRGRLVTATPGAQAGQPPRNNGDASQLIAGVLADGAPRVRRLVGTPSSVPKPPAGSYLIAMLTSATGFHFLRRSDLGAWTWKDGNPGTVKLNIKNWKTGKWTLVRDSDLKDLLVKKKNEFMWSYNTMTFQAFFSVPNGGIDVSA